MTALFIGHTYIDVTIISDVIPTGDDKAVASDYAVAFGGNAVTAAFCCAHLGVSSALLTTTADDWLGRMFLDMAERYGITIHPRPVGRSSLSFIMPRDGKRAILRARDDAYLAAFPALALDGVRVLHLDGHQPDAAIAYAQKCQQRGILTSLDGGGLRSNTHELLAFIDVAVVAERLCEQMVLTPHAMIDYLIGRGCKVAGVTLGEHGLVWREATSELKHLPAISLPASSVIDTNGAGDIFHGTYVHSFAVAPLASWQHHFERARAASTHAVQRLGNEAKLPAESDLARYLTQ
jgi:sugar/nucleoside kinase (ribokinase family)